MSPTWELPGKFVQAADHHHYDLVLMHGDRRLAEVAQARQQLVLFGGGCSQLLGQVTNQGAGKLGFQQTRHVEPNQDA
jgi:hypothetical protein